MRKLISLTWMNTLRSAIDCANRATACEEARFGKALPGAEEVISYRSLSTDCMVKSCRLPGLEENTTRLYLRASNLFMAFKDQLASYTISQGTIRFPLCAPIPVKLQSNASRSFRAGDTTRRKGDTGGLEGRRLGRRFGTALLSLGHLTRHMGKMMWASLARTGPSSAFFETPLRHTNSGWGSGCTNLIENRDLLVAEVRFERRPSGMSPT